MYEDVIFNEIFLSSILDVKINTVMTDSMPDIVISQGKLARQDGTKIFNKEYGSRKVLIEGHIQADSRANYLIARNQIVKATEPVGKTLQLPQDGTPVEFTATCSNIIFSDVGGGFARFSIEFICTDPYMYDVGETVLINGETTTSSADTFIYLQPVGGTVSSPPLIVVSVGAVTGGTSGWIELTSNAGEEIRVARNWVSGDVLQIDCLRQEVKVNGIFTDYTGVFFNVNVDDTFMDYADSFTTRTVGVTKTYKRRYL